jgi:photoactive yellow protein
MTPLPEPSFNDASLPARLAAATGDELDAWPFGVIGFDADGVVQRYNAAESRLAGLSPDRVLGLPLFTTVAPCMNNYLVAQRFEEARERGEPLDDTIDYVLTLRMRPIKVKLRLLATPGQVLRHVLVLRKA